MENSTIESPRVDSTFSSLHQVTPLSKYLAMLIFIILPFFGGWIGYSYAPEKIVYVEMNSGLSVSNDQVAQGLDMLKIEDGLELKFASTTKVFYSENLGIEFTYNPIVYPDSQEPSREVAVLEEGNKISLYIPAFGTSSAKTIEVFDKEPSLTIKEAISKKFLSDYKPEDCFVVEYDNKNNVPGYQYLGISYPPSTNPNAPFWENLDKCPGSYSEINAVRHFIFNPSVPDKYIFVDLGQDGLTTDGISNKDWATSIQILE